MATWTKTNNVITLTQDTTMSELVNDTDIPLVDADIIQLKGHNLIVDIITCGSADPDYNDEVNMGVTVKNDGGGECNLEFKDLSGIRLNATLPGTVHPWVDPDNPLPAFTKDPRKVIHGDPYCTKLTANARVEIQLANNISLGGGTANLPTEIREGNWYGKIISYSQGSLYIKINKILNAHFRDIFLDYSIYNNTPKKITNTINDEIVIESKTAYQFAGAYCSIMGGGVVINCISGNDITNAIITNNINFGNLNIIGTSGNGRYRSLFSNCIVNGIRLNERFGNSDTSNVISNNIIFDINECGCFNFYGWYYNGFGQNFGKINTLVCYAFNSNSSSITGTAIDNIKIKNLYNIVANPNEGGTHFNRLYGNYKIDNGDFYLYSKPSINKAQFLVNKNTLYISSGTIEKQDSSWHHKPNNASSMTWRYTDRLIPPHKYLFLRVFRLVESASQNSEARVAITDTVNWYPETKFGALADIVIHNIETDKWQTYSLKYKNESDEPQQVRVWECVSGSTDGGYLRVEEATGGPM